MTTSTSSSGKPWLTVVVAIAGLTTGCGPAANSQGHATRSSYSPAAATVSTQAAAKVAKPYPRPSSDLSELYGNDLDRAAAGEKKVPFTGSGGFGGMECSPQVISGRSAASRALTLTLPKSLDARRHALVVVAPERGLLTVYQPYDDMVEPSDIIIPSQVITWFKAKSQNRFASSAEALDGLRPHSETPQILFLEAGRYRFALTKGIDALTPRAGHPNTVKVIAACSFDWTP